MQKLIFIFFVLFFVKISTLYGQFEPCNSGEEPSCVCNQASVLCTIEDLDGHTYTMSTFEPDLGAPPVGNGSLCNQGGTVINNPTWFAFIAWCTNLTLVAHVSNCIDNPNNPGNTRGIQAAVYSSCSDPNSCIGSDVNNCSPNQDRTLVLSNLTIGATYYFLVDGCAGSACDVEIEVIGDCSLTVGDIEQTTGPTEVCGSTPATYMIPPVSGAALYHWYLNDVNIQNGPSTSVDIIFDNPGDYTLCVDISNPPCLLEADIPARRCFPITVTQAEAEAGTIEILTTPSCPGESIAFNVTGFNNNTSLFSEAVFLTDDAGTILQIFPGTSGSYSYPTCDNFKIYSYNYSPSSIQPVVGLSASTIICNDCFCDIKFVDIAFVDQESPVFDITPPSVTVDCIDEIPPFTALNWTDNCLGVGINPGIEVNQYTYCDGGTVMRTWAVTDLCGNSASLQQSIIIKPLPPPTFPDVSEVNLECHEFDTFNLYEELPYSNTGIGLCEISDFAYPVINFLDESNCTKNILRVWSATDICGREITQLQTINVFPPPEAQHVVAPSYSPVKCADVTSFNPATLDYSNNDVLCLIDGATTPVKIENYTSCGGKIDVIWEDQDICTRPLYVSRNVNVLPAPAPAITDPVPTDINVACGSEGNFLVPLKYSNELSGKCLISGTINPTSSLNYNSCGGQILVRWDKLTECGHSLSALQNIQVSQAPIASFISLPPDTVRYNCNDIPLNPSPLSFSNGITGKCGINGMVDGVVSGNFDICGGQLKYEWTYTDSCGRSITFEQIAIIEPAPDITFVNPPVSVLNLPCNGVYPNQDSLIISNSFPGPCLIEGKVEPEYIDFPDHRTYTWSYINACDNKEISVSQDVYLNPSPVFDINADTVFICKNDTVDLKDISYTTNATGNFIFNYFSGNNPNLVNELITTKVSPSLSEVFTIQITNQNGCSSFDTISVNSLINNQSGTGASIRVCNDSLLSLNLFDNLTDVKSFSGNWSENSSSGVSLTDPYNVLFKNITNGLYSFKYVVPVNNTCPENPAFLNIELVEPPSYNIVNSICSTDLLTYDVTLVAKGYTITSSAGDIIPGTSDTMFIKNIPSTEDVSVFFNNIDNVCSSDQFLIKAPRCDCPVIAPPLSLGDKSICFGESTPILQVSVTSGLAANWYASAGATIPFAVSTDSIRPTATNIGKYLFYVESLDTTTQCVSSTKTEVFLEILPLPLIFTDTISICDIDRDNQNTFSLTEIKDNLNIKYNIPLNYGYNFYSNENDANNQTNPITNDALVVINNQNLFLSLKSNNNCSAVSKIYLDVVDLPNGVGGADQILTCLNTQILLTGTTNIPNTAEFKWVNGAGTIIGTNSSVSINTPGSYYFEVIDKNTNCKSGLDEVIIMENKNIPLAQINSVDGSILNCSIDKLTLSATSAANVQYLWDQNGITLGNNNSLQIDSKGLVKLTVTDLNNGCTNTDVLDVSEMKTFPLIVKKPVLPITCINIGTYLDAGQTLSSSSFTFEWFNQNNILIAGANNDSLYVTKSGKYYLKVTDNSNFCTSIDSFVVDLIGDFPVVKVSDDINLFCGLTSADLTATVENPLSTFDVKWTTIAGNILTDASQRNIKVNGSGEYIVDVTYLNSGCKTTESVRVNVDQNYPKSIVTLVKDETCIDDNDGSIKVVIVNGGLPPFNFKLNNSISVVDSFANLQPGNYTLLITDANGCTTDTLIVIDEGTNINATGISPPELLFDQVHTVEIKTNLDPADIAFMMWTPSENLSCSDCLITDILIKKNQVYNFFIKDIKGCSDSVDIVIKVKKVVIINAPNIININNTVNNYFTIYGNDEVLKINKLNIYDRWGNLVFEKSNFKPNIPQEGWNGAIGSVSVQPGVYVFFAECLTSEGLEMFTGDITIVK